MEQEREELEQEKANLKEKEHKIREMLQAEFDKKQEELQGKCDKLEAERRDWEEEKERVKQTRVFEKVITLNVGGTRYTTTLSTLTKYPDSMLGAMFSGRHNLPQQEDGSYFIDRDGGEGFSCLLSYLRDRDLCFAICQDGHAALDELEPVAPVPRAAYATGVADEPVAVGHAVVVPRAAYAFGVAEEAEEPIAPIPLAVPRVSRVRRAAAVPRAAPVACDSLAETVASVKQDGVPHQLTFKARLLCTKVAYEARYFQLRELETKMMLLLKGYPEWKGSINYLSKTYEENKMDYGASYLKCPYYYTYTNFISLHRVTNRFFSNVSGQGIVYRSEISFESCDLSGMHFRNCYFQEGVSFEGCILRGTKFERVGGLVCHKVHFAPWQVAQADFEPELLQALKDNGCIY